MSNIVICSEFHRGSCNFRRFFKNVPQISYGTFFVHRITYMCMYMLEYWTRQSLSQSVRHYNMNSLNLAQYITK